MSRFLVMWDCNGLENVIGLGDIMNDFFMDALKGSGASGMNSLVRAYNGMTMRARLNSQRHYEIYTFETSVESTVDDVKQWFEETPQYIVDLIREKGVKHYSDRLKEDTRKIV